MVTPPPVWLRSNNGPVPFVVSLTGKILDEFDYSVPTQYEDYLTYRYGDWKIPVKEYDFKKDDKASDSPLTMVVTFETVMDLKELLEAIVLFIWTHGDHVCL